MIKSPLMAFEVTEIARIAKLQYRDRQEAVWVARADCATL